MKLHGPSHGTDQDEWPDGSVQRRAYFTNSQQMLRAFAPEEGKGVVVRVKQGDAQFRRESGTGDIYVDKPIETKHFEYLGSDKKWYPLSGFKKSSFDPDQPRDERGRWSEGGGGGTELPQWIRDNVDQTGLSGPVATGGGHSWEAELVQRGGSSEAVSQMKSLFDQHKWGGEGQQIADGKIAEAFNSDSELGRALRLQSDLEESIRAYYEQEQSKKVAAAAERSKSDMKEAWVEGWSPKNSDAYDSWEEQWRVEEEYKFKQEPLRYYRAGDPNKDVMATTTRSEGAQSHSVVGSASQPHYVPGHSWTTEELHARGYRVIAGFGYNQQSYSGEGEITWIRVKKIKKGQPLAKLNPNRAGPRTLYVSRRLLNAGAVRAWAASQGIRSALPPEDMHVTIAYSKEPVDWSRLEPMQDAIVVLDDGAVHQFPPRSTPNGALVLKFESPELRARWQELRDAGASWDFPEYRPHVTITYSVPEADVAAIEPYRGPLIFGPEEFAEVDDGWAGEIEEEPLAKMNPNHDERGRFAEGPGNGSGGGGGVAGEGRWVSEDGSYSYSGPAYHGTSPANLQSIAEHGLVPTDGSTWFASSEGAAAGYAGKGAVVLRIMGPSIEGLSYSGGSRFGGVNSKTSSHVSPDKIEAKINDKWVKLTSLAKRSIPRRVSHRMLDE